MTPSDPQYPIIDGFCFSTKLRNNYTFRNAATQQFEALRRATAYRNKMWVVPQDSTILIPARDSYERQVYMQPGSAIWGYSFCGNTGQQGSDLTQPTRTQSWEVRDACDDVPLFSEIVTRRFASQNPIPVVNPVPQQYLAKLLVVGPPGLLNVILANMYSTEQVGQLVLFGGEPVTE